MFNVAPAAAGVTLELYNINLYGWFANSDPMIQVGANGTLRMEDSELREGSMGGVSVSGGNFIMNSGAVVADSSGGVSLTAGAALIMNDTAIIHSNNDFGLGLAGGVNATGAGTSITMNGGFIENNASSISGGGVHLSGGASLIMSSTAEIRWNNAIGDGGGVFVGIGSSISGTYLTAVHSNFPDDVYFE